MTTFITLVAVLGVGDGVVGLAGAEVGLQVAVGPVDPHAVRRLVAFPLVQNWA